MNAILQTLSVVFITHNPGERFARALASVAWANEIIVLDGGSTDGTLTLARQYTDRVFFHPSTDPVILKREAFHLAQCDWILFLEPIEWIDEPLHQEIDALLKFSKNQCEGYFLNRKLSFMGQWISRAPSYLGKELRLFRRFKGSVVDNPHSPQITVEGSTRDLESPLATEPFQDVDELFSQTISQATLAAYQALEEGQGTSKAGVRMMAPPAQFFKQYVLAQGFRSGLGGLALAMAESCQQFLTQAKVQTLRQSISNSNPSAS